MTASTPTSGSHTMGEEPQGPYIKLDEAPYAPIRWLANEEFWKNVTINVYSAAVVAVFTVTLVSIAQMIKAGQYDNLFIPVAAGIAGIAGPPMLVLICYMIHQHNKLPKEGKRMAMFIFAVNIVISIVGVSAVIVLGISNIIRG